MASRPPVKTPTHPDSAFDDMVTTTSLNRVVPFPPNSFPWTQSQPLDMRLFEDPIYRVAPSNKHTECSEANIILKEILLHMNYGTRSSIQLSKRLLRLVSLSKLNFDDSETLMIQNLQEEDKSVNVENVRKYSNWVNFVLSLHSSPKIDEFRVCFVLCAETKYYTGDIDKWVAFAISKHVKKLELDFSTLSYSLRYDFLREFRFGIDGDFNLLTSLCLKFVNINGGLLDSILSCCRYLERIILEDSVIIQLTKMKNEVNSTGAVSLDVESERGIWEDCDCTIAKLKTYRVLKFTLEVKFVEDENINCLKSLCLRSLDNLSADLLQSLMIRFQFLEQLILENARNLVNMKISRLLRKLKHVSIQKCENFQKLEIDLLDIVSLEVDRGYSCPVKLSVNDNNDAIFLEFCPPKYAYVSNTNLDVKIDYFAPGTTKTVDNSDGDIAVSGEILESLLSRFSSLEKLTVIRSKNLVSLKIREKSSKSLQHLQIEYCHKLKKLKIHALNLTTLELSGNNKNANVIYGSVPSLVEVCYGKLSRHRPFIFEQMSFVSSQLTKLLLHTQMISEDVATAIPTFDNVRQLEFIVEIKRHQDLLPITRFAEACPLLHEFKLESSGEEEKSSKGEELGLDDVMQWLDTQDEDGLSWCTLAELRKFELVGTFQYDSHIDYEYSLVLYIIKNAIQLVKFICNVTDSAVENFCELAEFVKEKQTDAAQQLAKAIPLKIDVEII
ncbi:hypothetical protein RDABS01_006708 [Bienertia sinuspersici]